MEITKLIVTSTQKYRFQLYNVKTDSISLFILKNSLNIKLSFLEVK